MKLGADCIACLVSKQLEHIRQFEDEKARADYMMAVLKIIVNADEQATAPKLVADMDALYRSAFGVSYSYEGIKKEYNELLLQREHEIRARIDQSGNPLLLAVQLARVGNYIDFGAMKTIDNRKLDDLLERAGSEMMDPDDFNAFTKDLRAARRLAYLTDNCGEIVLDKLLIQTMKKQFPQLHITVIARGAPVLNDATVEDARAVGLQEVAEVLGNGTGIAGTQLNEICAEASEAILRADMIVSKGQGNYETMHGCGLNVYYLFLCKCDWFARRFRVKRYSGVFVREN